MRFLSALFFKTEMIVYRERTAGGYKDRVCKDVGEAKRLGFRNTMNNGLGYQILKAWKDPLWKRFLLLQFHWPKALQIRAQFFKAPIPVFPVLAAAFVIHWLLK